MTWEAGLKHTGVELEDTTDDKIRLLLENNMRGGPASLMGNRHVKRSDWKKKQNWDINYSYGKIMSQIYQSKLPYKWGQW